MAKTWWTVILFSTAFILGAQTQQEEITQEPLKEYIQVTNVEMVMRVIKDGISQGGFRKEEFSLLENGQECPINGFFELRKRMKPHVEKQEVATAPGRLFLLFFWASQPQTEINSHLDTFFKNVYLPQDRVILASNTQQVDIRSSMDVEGAKVEFLQKLKEELDKQKVQWNALHRNLAYEIDYLLSHVRLNKNGAEVQTFLKNFTVKYKEFMRETAILSQNVNFSRLNAMADDLRSINALKWVLVFFETSRIPMVNVGQLQNQVEMAITADLSADVLIDWFKALIDIEMATTAPGTQHAFYEKMRTRFIQSDTVFHYLSLSTPTVDTVREADENPLLSFRPIASDWENILKSITQVTGGRIGKIEQDASPLLSLFEEEDISYLLTYVPQNSRKKDRKIEIFFRDVPSGLGNKNLIYGKRIELAVTPSVKIDSLSNTLDAMQMMVSQFYPILTELGPQGHLNIEITGSLPSTPALTLYRGEASTSGYLEIPLKIPQPGEWVLNVTVTDSMTKSSDTKEYKLVQSARPVVQPQTDLTVSPASQPPPGSLALLLQKSGRYTNLLKKTALRFFCQEEIAEKVGSTSSLSHFKKWTYDYQIILQEGKLDEKRSLNKKKKKDEPVVLETLYKSHYSFFLPVTFLSTERQIDYTYTQIGTETMKKRQTVHITAVPVNPKSALPGGELWIDEADGAVLQIKIDPLTVPGFRNRYEMAASKDKKAEISDTHQYFLRFKGMQFPTSTFITETTTYNKIPATIIAGSRYAGYLKQFEPINYSVHFQYKDYRFFDVDTNEQITGWVEE